MITYTKNAKNTLLVILISIGLQSCGGGKNVEAEKAKADSAALFQDTTALYHREPEKFKTDSVLNEDYTVYCCGNHEPSHCGAVNELEDLVKKKGCKQFSAEQ